MSGEGALPPLACGGERATLAGGAAEARAEQLVHRHADRILRVSYTYLHTVQDAEDICQEVLLRALQRREPFHDEEHERAWILRVTINACKDVLRRNRLRNAVALEDVPEPAAPRAWTEEAERRRQLRVLDAVMQLPLSLRTTIYLRYYENYETRDIARVLGCSEAAVAARLSRGRKRLRGMLKEVADDEFDF